MTIQTKHQRRQFTFFKCQAIYFVYQALKTTMSDKKKFTMPAAKLKRPSTTSSASTSRTRVPQTAIKDRTIQSRQKTQLNNTIIAEGDLTIAGDPLPASIPAEFEEEYRQISYNKFLRAMLEDCLVDEKIEREETEIDVQMTHLAKRLQQTVDQLDKTSKRLKEINFVVEQQRLLDLKKQDTTDFYDVTDKSNAEDILRDLKLKEQASLNRLETKNVEFGYDKISGHKQLLDAVDDALTGLEEIKRHSQLDVNKFKQYEKSMESLQDIGKDRFDMETLKKEFEVKFPTFSEKLLKQCSDSISKMMNDDSDDD